MKELTMALAAYAANATLEVYSKLKEMIVESFPIASIALALAIMAISANAANLTVTNTNDAGAGSLRQAVLDANLSAGPDAIDFAFTSPQTIVLTSGELAFPGTITVTGSPLFAITISGNNNSRIFNGSAGTSNLTLNFLNLTAGHATGNGGAISMFGPLAVNNCAIYGNSAVSGGGGAIYFADSVAMNRSTVSGNTATGSGGGMVGEFASGIAVVTDSTIAFNHAGNVGGGGHNSQGGFSVKNSIIAQNTATNGRPDFSQNLNSQGYNIIGDTSGATLLGVTTGNQLNVDPLLQSLALNNGPTMTHGLQSASTAIDAGDPARLQVPDQRGAVRGADGDSDGTRGGDIGAYEKQKSAFNFNGDELSDLSVIRVNSGQMRPGEGTPEGITGTFDWYLQNGPTTYGIQSFGISGDLPVPADYDGDGKTDVAIYRPSDGTWYILGSQNGLYGYRWGISTDIPVPADYDGDGKADVATYRNGDWYILKTTLGYQGIVTLGQAGNRPVPADYDGDGKADLAVYTGTNWQIAGTSQGLTNDLFGVAGDIPVPADFDGDGKANLAIFRPGSGTWYIAHATGTPGQNFDAYSFGLSNDKLVPGDYDGDGKTDVAVYRGGTWYIQGSRLGLMVRSFGVSGDKAIPSYYLH